MSSDTSRIATDLPYATVSFSISKTMPELAGGGVGGFTCNAVAVTVRVSPGLRRAWVPNV
jgi:hypothetical protein